MAGFEPVFPFWLRSSYPCASVHGSRTISEVFDLSSIDGVIAPSVELLFVGLVTEGSDFAAQLPEVESVIVILGHHPSAYWGGLTLPSHSSVTAV